MRRVHVIGCPRSGTTLMLQLLAASFVADGHCDFELTIYKEPDIRGELYFSKRPTDSKIIKPIFLLDPDLYIIHMVRDPRDVVCSIHPSVPDKYFCQFLLWQECDSGTRDIAPHPRWIMIRYEDLIQAPDAVQQRISQQFDFLQTKGLFSEFHRHCQPSHRAIDAMKGLQPIHQNALHSWKNHLPRIKAELMLFPEMTEALIYHKYEVDDSWQQQLAGVEPLFSSSRHKTRKNFFKRLDWRFRNWRKRRKKIAEIKKRLAKKLTNNS